MIDALLILVALVAFAVLYLLCSLAVGHAILWCMVTWDVRKRGRRLTKAGFDVDITYRPNVITLRAEHPVSGRVRAVRQRVSVFM